MKKYLLTLATLLALIIQVQAQSVPRKAVAEHFTNSWCGICAGVNPSLYATLRNNPNILHISYFPSSPYSGCQINRLNTAGNDTRTRYYDAYGSTPRVVLQGSTLISGGSFTSSSLFNSIQNQTSPLSIRVITSNSTSDSVRLRVVITKVGDFPENSLLLYGIISTDTLQFNAQNGERTHYNVFRTALNGNSGTSVQVPARVADSLVLNYRIANDPNWGRVSATFFLQTANRAIVQAERATIGRNVISSVSKKFTKAKVFVFNSEDLQLKVIEADTQVAITVFDNLGREVIKSLLSEGESITLAQLPRGIYQVVAPEYKQSQRIMIP